MMSIEQCMVGKEGYGKVGVCDFNTEAGMAVWTMNAGPAAWRELASVRLASTTVLSTQQWSTDKS